MLCWPSDEELPGYEDPVWKDPLWRKELAALDKFRDSCSRSIKGPRHQLGGLPVLVQATSMELQCQLVTHGLYCGDATGYEDPRAKELAPGATDWLLLFQVDSDENPDMMWVDGGLIYFWIRRQDLVGGRFDQSWLILETT